MSGMNAFARQFVVPFLACLFAGITLAEPPVFPLVDMSRLDRPRQCPDILDCGGVVVKMSPCIDYTTYVKDHSLDCVISDLPETV